ncbi:MAG: potassium-transporting ATPase subunit KdpA [Anaerolineae bacterium]|nr:potassium-transporting ATPase subunit KdpA [Anaerolineae bacterium]
MMMSMMQILLFAVLVLLLVKPLGRYMAQVYQGERTWLDPLLRPVERWLYRLAGVEAQAEMNWRGYTGAMLLFNGLGLVVLYGLLRLQSWLPLNPAHLPPVPADLAFNTAASFVSNTNWQNYGGETTLSYLTQMVGLTVQNFVSAATGMAVLVALMRGMSRHSRQAIGNFWVDLTRSVLYILLPLSIVWTMLLVSQGVVQTLAPYQVVHLLQPTVDAVGQPVAEQTLAVGPAASQIAIKQLGTNGGGFFNTNAAHPFENPTPLANLVELLAILLIPTALCYTFGLMIGDVRQGWAVLIAMTLIYAAFVGLAVGAEQGGNPLFEPLGVDQTAAALQSGGNMEGKEVRFGSVNSALWAVSTTATSNGSVNSMHDSYTPLGGLAALLLMQLGEVVYGGVGCGLYGMLAFIIVAVFVAGLMVGRTPEYLGKKIEAYEMKMAAVIILISPLLVLVFTALALTNEVGLSAISQAGPHGFSEVLYAYSSQGNNNGSAFAGLAGNSPYYNLTGGIVMLSARFLIAVPILAIAGSLAAKKRIPVSAGTLPTHTPLFVGWIVVVVVMVGALSFLPALALGPIVEYLLLGQGVTF